jgi:hypothetical protein
MTFRVRENKTHSFAGITVQFLIIPTVFGYTVQLKDLSFVSKVDSFLSKKFLLRCKKSIAKIV